MPTLRSLDQSSSAPSIVLLTQLFRRLACPYRFWLAIMFVYCAVVFCSSHTLAAETGHHSEEQWVIPDGDGQLRQNPTLFDGGTDDHGRAFLLNGQIATNGKIILNASNGFFDHGICRGLGQSKLPRSDDERLIGPNFQYLGNWTETNGSIRWHFWIEHPGMVRFLVRMRVSPEQAASTIRVDFAKSRRVVHTAAAKESTAQPWGLEFEVEQRGEHTLEISADKIAAAGVGVGDLFEIIAIGPAIEGAKLLRARWRPAAVHGSYASSSCNESRVWVLSTRSTKKTTSYSPITTPFGYFGTSFGADMHSVGSFNFSMWASGSGGRIPPLKEMPHLLAVGSPEAEFSGFGHEGSGVKIRDWVAMPDHPETVIQSLRVENDGDYHTYYGYFWDHQSERWTLYAVGRKWSGGKPIQNLKPGSFCEVPGPADVQRTGDQPREVVRRGWCMDDIGKWHALDQFHCSKRNAEPMNKAWYVTQSREFAMTTGGMRYYKPVAEVDLNAQQNLPSFLSPAATKQLYQLPAKFEVPEAVDVSETDAAINVKLADAGEDAVMVLYYGEIDCLTFAPRKLHATEQHSEVSKAGQNSERTWSNSTAAQPVLDGNNVIHITGLSPQTTYFYRALLVNKQGKIWMFDTHSLKTK